MFLVNLLILIVNLSCVIVAWSAIRQAKKANQGTVIKQYMEEYSSQEICDALRQLRDWKSSNANGHFAETWMQKFKENDSEAQKVNMARRKVAHFFYHIIDLFKMEFISERTLRYFGDYDGVDFFLE